jgi:hypothetical protein
MEGSSRYLGLGLGGYSTETHALSTIMRLGSKKPARICERLKRDHRVSKGELIE